MHCNKFILAIGLAFLRNICVYVFNIQRFAIVIVNKTFFMNTIYYLFSDYNQIIWLIFTILIFTCKCIVCELFFTTSIDQSNNINNIICHSLIVYTKENIGKTLQHLQHFITNKGPTSDECDM